MLSSTFVVCARLAAVLCLAAVPLLAQRNISFVVPDNQIAGSAQVRVMLDSLGDESSLAFSLSFDPAILSYSQVTTGADATTASLSVNTTQLSQGRIGIVVTRPAGSAFAAGAREIARITFASLVSSNVATSLVAVSNPVPLNIGVIAGDHTTATWVNSFFTAAPAPSAPTITYHPSNITVVAGSNATFSSSAIGSPAPDLQWQRQPAAGGGFVNILPSAGYSGVNLSNLTVTGPTTAMNGDQFRVVATNASGSATSAIATLAVVQSAPFFQSTASVTFTPGVANTFTVVASGSPAPTYAVAAGSLPSWATFNNVTGVLSGTPPAGSTGQFSFPVTATNGFATTQSFLLNVAPLVSRLASLSARSFVSSAGISQFFTIDGAARTVLLRGAGPALASFGISGALADPTLTVINATTAAVVATNDNWNSADAPEMSAAGAFSFSAGSRDAALVATLPAGTYAVHLTGVGGAVGEALLEFYDRGSTGDSAVSYLALRGSASPGNPIIAGFVLSGSTVSRHLLRGLGPALGDVGMLSNPRLDLYSGITTFASNDNWWIDSSMAATFQQFGASTLNPSSLDSAMAVTLAPGAYSAHVGTSSGTSGTALLEIYGDRSGSLIRAPFFLAAPSTRTAFAGTFTTLTAPVNGTGPFTYQWRKNGTRVPNGTSATLTFSSLQSSDAGNYDVVVTNSAGSATSPVTTLTINTPIPPTITSQPASGLINLGNVIRFAVTATGTTPLSYQWRKNGVPITGATSSVLGFTSVAPDQAGVYDVLVSNLAATVLSAPATVSFGQLPLTEQPVSRFVRTGEPVEFPVTPFTAPGTTYQWLKNGAAISRQVPLYNLEGEPQGQIASGEPIPAGRWTARNGGAMWQAGLGVDQSGQIAGVVDTANYAIGTVTLADIGNYTVNVTANSTTTTRGPAALALRGNGTLGRRHFAVGAGGTLITSENAVTWTARATNIVSELRGVAAQGDVAVAVGQGGVILRSTDAINWTLLPPTAGVNLNAVVAGPDRFVAVGDSGRVLVSPNGADWYLADSRTNTSITGVAYGNGTYIFTGANGAIFVSPDGFRWQNRNSQTTSPVQFVTFAGDQFWALAGSNQLSGGHQLLTSSDGFTWTRSPVVAPAWFRSLTFDGSSLVAVGTEGRIHTSTNGITWTPRAAGLTTQPLLSVTWSGGELPAAFSPAAILSDLDFRITRPPHAISAVIGQPAAFVVATSGGSLMYQWSKDGAPILGATQSTLPFAAIQASDVGDYSVTITSPAGQLTSPVARLALLGSGPLGGQFLAVGDSGTVAASTDGFTFTERASTPAQVLRAVAASAFRAVAVGRANAVALSSDGLTWSSRTLLLPGEPRILRGVAAGLSQFVAVGSAGTILASFDQGETWSLVASGTGQSLYGVAWDRTRFVAVGESGVVLSSADGITWAAASSPTSERLYSIAATGPKLIAVSLSGAVFESTTSGASWQSAGSSSALWARGAAISPSGRRVVVGDRGVIATSANGTSWSLASSPTSERLYGVTWTGGVATLSGAVADAVNGPALRIVTPPASATVSAGATAVLSVTAAGVSPLSYQWQRDSADVPGGNGATLLLPNISAAHAGNYTVVVTNPTGSIVSAPALLTVTPATPGNAPVIISGPEDRTVNVGGSANFSVSASGSAPLAYRWLFNGQTIPGAATTMLSLSGIQLANAGSYSVVVSNASGSVTSAPALLTVTTVPGLPTFTQHPLGQAIAAGGRVTFTAAATGSPTITYQWRKDGAPISGATIASLTLDPVSLSNAGVYTVAATNFVGTVISEPASLTIVPPGTTAAHTQTSGAGYTAGAAVTIRSTITYVGDASSLGWEVLLPTGWSLASSAGTVGDVQPAVGETQLLSWAWTNPPPSPVTFTYTLNVPAGTAGPQSLAALAILRQGGVAIRLMAHPDPLIISPAGSLHSADTNGDSRLDLFELTRVIELFNCRNGTNRTGAYRTDATTEDGFATDPTRAAGSATTPDRRHSADTQGSTDGSAPDGALNVFELTRVIELYNHRVGTLRTGQYHVQPSGEDGFAPGP